MRIVHVVETLEVGGAEHMVVALAALQRARGHEVSIVCLFREGPLAVRARAAGVEVGDCAKQPGLDLGAVARLRRWIKGHRAQVLHTHNAVPHYYGVAAQAGCGVRRVVNTRHGMGAAGPTARRDRLYRLTMPFTDHAVAVCDAARERFVSQRVIPRAKAVTVVNGIDLARVVQRSDAAKDSLLASLRVQGRPLVFGTVGRLNALKDQRTLLRAFAQIEPASHAGAAPAILVIAGEGEMRATLEDERARLGLEGRVFLLGQRDDVPQVLAGCDVFVLSSITEGYSLALVEAAAAGLPMLATDVGGNAEIVAQGRTGMLVPASDPQALAKAMTLLAHDRFACERMGGEARRWALANGSILTMGDRYDQLYAAQSLPKAVGHEEPQA